MQKKQQSMPKAWERLQEMIRNCPHRNITQQRIVHISYGEVSLYNMMSSDVACGGNLMLKPPINTIKIIEGMCSNPCNNFGDMKIMKKGVN